MIEPIDWCKYFRAIEDDPKAMTPQLTVRQFIQAREHLYGCDTCNNRVERVLSKHQTIVFPKERMN